MLEFNSPRGSDLSVQLSEDSHGAGEVPGDPPLSLHGGSEGIQLLQGHSLPHSLWILRSYSTILHVIFIPNLYFFLELLDKNVKTESEILLRRRKVSQS